MKKKNLQSSGFCYRVKIKESEKIEKYLDLAWEWKKLWNMKVSVILIVIGALWKKTGRIERGRIKTIQIIALLRQARILRRVLEPWRDHLSLRFQWKTTGMKNWQIMMINNPEWNEKFEAMN